MLLEKMFEICTTQSYKNTAGKVSYAVTREGAHLYIWFECSNGTTDWLRNLNFPAKAYGDCKHIWFCHRGFLGAWKEVLPFLTSDIFDTSVRKITVVGYSHGAALAFLGHEYIAFHRPDCTDTLFGVGFGCPRVVWGFVPACVKARLSRFLVVRNEADLVTHLPPAVCGYRHITQILEIGARCTRICAESHAPDRYLAALRGI